MGASGDKDNTTISPPTRGVQSFMKTDGTYDWSRDGPGVYYLKAAQAAKVSSITFFANAQPAALTSNLSPCGTKLDTLSIPNYVAYIQRVVEYWAGQGITIDYISPMNEPDNSFSKCQQEGMAVDTTVRVQVFQQLKAALTASTSPGAKAVKVLGDETSQIASQALMEYTGSQKLFSQTAPWLPDTLSGGYIDAIAVHMYDFPDDATLKNYKQLVVNTSAATANKGSPPPIKMTEISSYSSALGVRKPWGQTGPSIMVSEFDPSIDNALDMARMIWQWMTLVNAESFDWWTVVSTMLPCDPTADSTCPSTYQTGNGWNDAFIYIDPNYATNKNYNFYLTKRYWVFKHFTTYIRPGAVRYDIPNDVLPYGTVAMASKGVDNIWNTVFINRNESAQTITLQLPATGGKIVGMVQTTDQNDWLTGAQLPTIAKDDTVKIALPARGVLSMQFTVGGSQTPPTAIASRNVVEKEKLQQRDDVVVGDEIVERRIERKPSSRFARRAERLQQRDILVRDEVVERPLQRKPRDISQEAKVQQRDVVVGDEIVEHKIQRKPRNAPKEGYVEKRDVVVGNAIIERPLEKKPRDVPQDRQLHQRDVVVGDVIVEHKLQRKPRSDPGERQLQQRDILTGDEVMEHMIQRKPRH